MCKLAVPVRFLSNWSTLAKNWDGNDSAKLGGKGSAIVVFLDKLLRDPYSAYTSNRFIAPRLPRARRHEVRTSRLIHN